VESSAVGSSPAGTDDSRRRPARPSLRPPGSRWLTLLGLFAVLTLSVELGWWGGLDRSVDDWAASHRVRPLWNVGQLVFDAATPEIALPIVLVLGVLVAWRSNRWALAVDAAVRVGLVVASVLLLKPLLAIPGLTRDPLGDQGGAFPSGHAASTVVCVSLLLAWLGRPRSAAGRVAVSSVVVAVVAVSVTYLGFHTVSEAVGGVLLGVVIATLPLPVMWRRRDPE
jgi:membrane-associated phospholipid phosphatase